MKSRERRERGLGKGMLLLLSILMTGVVFAQSYEKSSKITKSFYATEETEIQISNKYGNIHVIPWEKDSVKFEIILSVRANKESKVDKLFDNVDFDFTSTRYYVIAKTAFHKNTFFKDVSNQIFSGDNNIQVDYYVNIPAQCKIIIDNKFGNIYSTDHHGEVDIKLSNGDLKVNDLHQDAKISVEFGNTYINSMNSGSLKIYYGDLELESADDLQFEGKSANVNINQIEIMTINSRRDKFKIKQIGSLNGEMSFSYINIKELDEEMLLTTKYGDINVESFNKSFSLINIEAEFTDIKMFVINELHYDMEIIHNSKTTIKVPENLQTENELIDKNTDKRRTWGSVSETENLPEIMISIRAGYVSLIKN